MERRSKLRFPVAVEVRYRALEHEPVAYHLGKTRDISNDGVLVSTRTAHHIRAGATVEFEIAWACPLAKAAPLHLVGTGTVVRCGKSTFAATFERHAFRVQGRQLACSGGQGA